MLSFNEADPFPLPPAGIPYEALKRHAAAADAWLGLRIAETERALAVPADGQERWEHKGAEVFLTPYCEIREILEELSPREGEVVVDLGAGYGRMGFVLARHFPAADFLGYELVPERVSEGSRVLAARKCYRARLMVADLCRITPEAAKFYFLYDYGTRAAIEKTLVDLREIAARQEIVVVGRGRAVRDAIERRHPWLGGVQEPRHRPNYSIYRS